VGYSDHTEGSAVSIAAVALGACAIEKHFTLDRSLPGPDHAASLPAAELPEFVKALRIVGTALGSPRKVPSAVEIPNRAIARRSVVAKTYIKRGERFSIDNLTLKRPGTGITASRFDDLLRRVADRDYSPDDLIEG
jgi:sialic acid synthase SpsE